jgi:GNAT superfamily N-acetyltransferase
MKQLNGELAKAGELARAGMLADVRIRPYGLKDRERLGAMSARLSSTTLYLRFFSGSPRIPETYLRNLDRMDHWNHDALVALLDGDMIGIAEYIRVTGRPDHAELATLVADDWQHHGLGRCLITMLAELAQRRGIKAFDADIMLENRVGIWAVQRGWPAATPHLEAGAAHYRLPLPVPSA